MRYASGDIRNIHFWERANVYAQILRQEGQRSEKFRGTRHQNRKLKEYLHLFSSGDLRQAGLILANTRSWIRWLRQSPGMQGDALRVRDTIFSYWDMFLRRLFESRDTIAEKPETSMQLASRITRWRQHSVDIKTGESYYPPKARELGDYVARVDTPKTGKDSCGAAVGTLLNNFWLRKYLPQSWRDGKNWDTFLDRLVTRGLFKKVPCAHPRDARSGWVLVYNGWPGTVGSAANREHWHVEIVSSDGEYVSYVKASKPGGSARNAPNAKSMGFCGNVYYPV